LINTQNCPKERGRRLKLIKLDMRKRISMKISMKFREIKRIIREYLIYFNKQENLEEIDTFLNAYDFIKLNEENINYQNRTITSNENEAVIVSQQRKT
jgi:hypothetical protein